MPNSPRPGQKTAMISSTSLDLPEHRKQVVEACLRESAFPIGMEHLPVRDANAITVDHEIRRQNRRCAQTPGQTHHHAAGIKSPPASSTNVAAQLAMLERDRV